MKNNKMRGFIEVLLMFIIIMAVALAARLLMIKGVMDIATDSMKEMQKLHQENAKIKMTIEGIVESVSHLEPEESKDLEKAKKSDSSSTVFIGPPKKERTIVKFKDGRVKEFSGTYQKPIITEKYVIIEYDGNNEISNITETAIGVK